MRIHYLSNSHGVNNSLLQGQLLDTFSEIVLLLVSKFNIIKLYQLRRQKAQQYTEADIHK